MSRLNAKTPDAELEELIRQWKADPDDRLLSLRLDSMARRLLRPHAKVEGERTFRFIMADPDWKYDNWTSTKNGAAAAHFPGSSGDSIAEIPVSRWARRDTILFLWTTLPKLDIGIDVMRRWGFELITSIPWVKTAPKKGDIRRGIGFWVQQCAEVLLVCRVKGGTGKAPVQTLKNIGLLVDGEGRGPNPVFYAPRASHSRKPLSLIEWIESTLPGPRLELYATGQRPGWECWGHNTGWHLCASGRERFEVSEGANAYGEVRTIDGAEAST